MLTDTLPAGVTFVSANATQGMCTQAAGVVTCNIGTMTNGASVTATIVITTQVVAASTMINNSASVAGAEFDPSNANNTASATTTVNPAVQPDFSLSASPPSFNLPAGLTATYTVTATSLGGFTGTVNLNCSGNPPQSACLIEPTSVMLSANGSSTAALVIQTRLGSQFPVVQGQGMKPGVRLPVILAWLLLLLLALTAFVNTRRRGWAAAVPRLAVVLLLCVLIQGCARLGRGTPPGTYSITVTGTSGNTSHTTQVTLLVR